MNDLQRSGSRLPRRATEERAYRLVMAGGTLGLLAAVGLVLAAVDVIGFGLPILAAILAGICVVLFRRTVSS